MRWLESTMGFVIRPPGWLRAFGSMEGPLLVGAVVIQLSPRYLRQTTIWFSQQIDQHVKGHKVPHLDEPLWPEDEWPAMPDLSKRRSS